MTQVETITDHEAAERLGFPLRAMRKGESR